MGFLGITVYWSEAFFYRVSLGKHYFETSFGTDVLASFTVFQC